MLGRIACLALVGGCGRVGFEAIAPGTDGGGDTVDAGPFGPGIYVSELDSTFDDFDPSMTADRLELYFSSLRPGGLGRLDIWRATRLSATDAWSVPQPVDELNSIETDGDAHVAPDGLTIMFASDGPPSAPGNDELYISTRVDRAAAWSAPQQITDVSSSAEEFGPCFTPDLSILVFHSSRAGLFDLYASTRSGTAWSPPQAIAELNSAGDDADPSLGTGGLVLAFGSTRLGTWDLWIATRADVTSAFEPPVPIAELNTGADDFSPWISEDLHVLLFTRAVNGTRAIFEATR